uniref:FACT complex subunit SSRP1 n=1 Tax=Aceria tosichella TaxID=561515 RepID=A0A6G1S5Y2_9ACAR
MDENLELNNVFREERGALSECRLTFRPQSINFKNIKTGKIVTVSHDDIKSISWQRFATNHGIRLITKSGNLHRFDGLRPTDKDKIKAYIERNYDCELEDRELSLKGSNWGNTEFDGESLSLNLDGATALEIPLNSVSDCTSNKNEVIFSFHHNDDAIVGMTDMRLYMPGKGEDAIKSFVDQVLNRASVIKVTGKSVATFTELQCLTPRGRYDIKLFPSFIQLHGKTFDYKIPVKTVLRLFQLPHKDGRQAFFILSLDPPIVQGQTRYQFLQFLFYLDEEETVSLDMSEEELQQKYEGKLTKQMSGPSIDIFANVVKSITNKRINMPDYKNPTNSAITCSYKNNIGFLYPLERGFLYVHKPAIHVRFEEINSINFARSHVSTRSFDLEIETKANTTLIFNSIEKEEYPRLYDFVSKKKLRIKNRPTKQVSVGGIVDELVDSDDEDAYLAHVKSEGKAREAGEGDDDDDDEDEEDEDFDPNAANSDASEESNSSDDDDMASEFSEDEEAKKKSKPKKASTSAKASEKPSAKKAKSSASKPSAKDDAKKRKSKADASEDDERNKKYKSSEFVESSNDSSSESD